MLTRALGLQSGGSRRAGRGAQGLRCGLAVGEGIVLVLLTEPSPRAGLGWEATTGLVDWVILFPSPTGLPIPTGSPFWPGPNALQGAGKQQSSCTESAICRAQFIYYLHM